MASEPVGILHITEIRLELHEGKARLAYDATGVVDGEEITLNIYPENVQGFLLHAQNAHGGDVNAALEELRASHLGNAVEWYPFGKD
jgi:hypothetical protein